MGQLLAFMTILGPAIIALVAGVALIRQRRSSNWLGIGLLSLVPLYLLSQWVWFTEACWETWQPCDDSAIGPAVTAVWILTATLPIAGLFYAWTLRRAARREDA